jgi:hypothetical protein
MGTDANGDAHSTQNLALLGFSAPHFEQRISASPLRDPYSPSIRSAAALFFLEARVVGGDALRKHVIPISRAQRLNQELRKTQSGDKWLKVQHLVQHSKIRRKWQD